MLAFPRLKEGFEVEVDASDVAFGGVLSQRGKDGNLHPVAYFSDTVKKSQQNWAPTTKEAFALVLAIRHWYVYLAGNRFVLHSDHNPLVYLRTQKDPRGKFGRWIMELEEYEYVVKYVPGPKNVKADALSRNRSANKDQPPSNFEEKIYAVDDQSFLEQLRDEQSKDDVISVAMRCIESDRRIEKGRLKRVQNQLRIENGVLRKSGRPVVPASLRHFVVSELHNTGHFGVDKTYSLLRDRFFWPNMYKYVSMFVGLCETCQKTKCDTNPPKAPLLPMVIPSAPMQFISLDIAHMPVDDDGYQYLLLIGDIFSKYIAAVALRDQTAKSIVRAFSNNWIYAHGNPYYLLSDQGSNVDGDTVRTFCDEFGIEKRRSSAYHSQGNGFAERNIRSIKDVLRAVLLQRRLKQSKWRKLLPELVFALNCSESKAINCTPYKVVFGRAPVLPIDIRFDVDQDTRVNDVVSPAEYFDERSFVLQDMFNAVIQELQLSKLKMVRQYNRNLRVIDYKEGDRVLMKVKHYKTGENRKLAPRRGGPWIVLEKLPNGVNFKVRNLSSNETKVVHHDRLSPFRETNTGALKRQHPVEENQEGEQSLNSDSEVESDSEGESDSDTEAHDGSSVYDPSSDGSASSDPDAVVEPRRYPVRNRAPREIPGAIPWDAVEV